jgi:lipopolysaccharide/colanic/teichoic acid biosynthesis glycosyltransferase
MEERPLLIDIDSRTLDIAEYRHTKDAVRSRARRRKPEKARRTSPEFAASSPRRWYIAGKGIVEYALTVVAAIFAAPLVLLSAILVKLTSSGPAFYTQTRVGRNGRSFTIYKIRTMVHECESLTGPRWSMPGDPRITRIGHFLRKTHLDELPQLFNVLRGDMGLIGPRPERPEFVPRLERVLPQYRQRLSIRPGITGLAQVHFSSDTDIESVRRKLALDLHYIVNARPGLDLRILLATGFYAIGNPLGLSRRIAAVRADDVEPCYLRADQFDEEPVRMKRSA